MKSHMKGPQIIKNRSTIWSSNPTTGNMSYGYRTENQYIEEMFALLCLCSTIYYSQEMKAMLSSAMDECIKKMWCTYKMEYYSIIKNKALLFATTWKNLEDIMANEMNQS
jgi:hypothetical protein